MTASKLPFKGIIKVVKLYQDIFVFISYVDTVNDKWADDVIIRGLNSDADEKEEYVGKEEVINDYAKLKKIKLAKVRKICKIATDFGYLEHPFVRDKEVLFLSSKGVGMVQQTKYFKYGKWLEVTKHLAMFISVLALVISLLSVIISILT